MDYGEEHRGLVTTCSPGELITQVQILRKLCGLLHFFIAIKTLKLHF
jgi:hypothetical protein